MNPGIRLVANNTSRINRSISLEEKQRDHYLLIEEYLLTRSLRNHANKVISESRRLLNNFFLSVGKFCLDVTMNDVKEYLEALLDIGLAASTRRGYIGEVKMFYEFLIDHPTIPVNPLLQSHNSVRIDQKYGVTICQPVDRWYLPRHITDDHPQTAIPSKEQLKSFFTYLRYQINSAQKPTTLARDYAMIRFLYHTGLRREETSMIDVNDIRFDLGTVDMEKELKARDLESVMYHFVLVM